MTFLEVEEIERKNAVERLNKEEMEALRKADSAKGIAAMKKARIEGKTPPQNPDYYKDEYTTGEKEIEGFNDEDMPDEETEYEPEEPEENLEAKPKQETIVPVAKENQEKPRELTAQEIYEQGVNAGITIGFKRAIDALIEKL